MERANTQEAGKATPKTSVSYSRAMELLNSIKKQRELLSQTLTTTKMPRDLALDSRDEVTSPFNNKTKKQGSVMAATIKMRRRK